MRVGHSLRASKRLSTLSQHVSTNNHPIGSKGRIALAMEALK
jgi:hypothetical protein